MVGQTLLEHFTLQLVHFANFDRYDVGDPLMILSDQSDFAEIGSVLKMTYLASGRRRNGHRSARYEIHAFAERTRFDYDIVG